ncbi:helix-turn-helix domain-containing protein [Priestia megaterium]|uniref:helix-turn-helix domain-containing protein n=1 Tax=Priestia megaterium TaxID=1404 RepID=UPI003C12F7D8
MSYMKEHETSIFETAAIFNLPSDKTLWTWRHLLETQGLDALKSTQKLFITVKEKEKNLLFFYLIMFSFF